MGIGILSGCGVVIVEFAMPDLDLIKQGEQGVRVRRYRIFDHLKNAPSIASPWVGAMRRPRTGSAKQSRAATPLPVEIASSRRGAPHNDAAPSWSRPNRLPRLSLAAEAGEQIVVTRRGRAVACLGPLPRRQPMKYGELCDVFLSEDSDHPGRDHCEERIATKQSRCGEPPPVRDCFAEPVLGRRIAPTRGLAMTGSNLPEIGPDPWCNLYGRFCLQISCRCSNVKYLMRVLIVGSDPRMDAFLLQGLFHGRSSE